MTKQEIKNLIGLATANFPGMQEKNMAPTAVLWDKMLEDIPYPLAEKALQKVLSTAKFFPTIAEIRQAALELTQPPRITAAEAWGQVIKAIDKYGSYKPKEALDSMDPEVADMTRRFGFIEICRSENIDVIRGQFIKLWGLQMESEHKNDVLPASLKRLVGGIGQLPGASA